MSAQHTPGPWTVYDPEMPDTEATYGIDGPSGQPVVYFGLTQNDGINRLEDARLIAAAPDLLAALQAVLHDCENLDMVESNEPGRDIGPFEMAMAAITKAIG